MTGSTTPDPTPARSTAGAGRPAAGLPLATSERQLLADRLMSAGPDAPTLCDGWRARDLVAHLVIREYRPDAAVGILFPPLAGRTEKVQRHAASLPYEQLVEKFRQGPPNWNPMRLADKQINATETFIHHEDLRRAGENPEGPRDLPQSQRDELWRAVGIMGRLILRRSNVHVSLRRTDATEGQPVLRLGGDTDREVELSGDAGELLLWVLGRDSVAQVETKESAPGLLSQVKRMSL